MTNKEFIIKELWLLCEQVDIDSIENSAPIIARFGFLLIDDPLLVPISNEMYKLEVEERKSTDKILRGLARKLHLICKAITDYVRKQKIYLIEVPSRDWDNLKYREFNNPVTLFLQKFSIERILTILYKSSPDHREFIERYVSINNENKERPIIWHQDVEKLIEQYAKDSTRSLRIEKTTVWYSFREVIEFSIMYDPALAQQRKNGMKNVHGINSFAFDVKCTALKRAIGPVKDNPQYREMGFDPRDYKMNMQRAALHIQHKLGNFATETPTLSKDTDWAYDPATCEFKLSNKNKHKFRKYILLAEEIRSAYGYPSAVLAVLTKKDKIFGKSLSLDYLYELITREARSDSSRSTIYDACKQINSILNQKCDLEEFLIFDTTTVRINPEYI